MKTLITLAFTSMIALPAFANNETENVKDVTDVYVAQHSHDLQTSMQAKIKKDILFAIHRFNVSKHMQTTTLIVNNNPDVEEYTEQVDIE